MTIGGEMVRNERTLLASVEGGRFMMSPKSVKYLVLHCSATRCNQDYPVEQLRRDHLARGFRDIGYHFYVRKDGSCTQHRLLLEVGAHARPYNRCVAASSVVAERVPVEVVVPLSACEGYSTVRPETFQPMPTRTISMV